MYMTQTGTYKGKFNENGEHIEYTATAHRVLCDNFMGSYDEDLFQLDEIEDINVWNFIDEGLDEYDPSDAVGVILRKPYEKLCEKHFRKEVSSDDLDWESV